MPQSSKRVQVTFNSDPAKASADVLRVRSKGLVKLTAIDPSGPQDVMRGTKCFQLPQERGAMRRWIAARDGKLNIYFEPNPPRGRADKRSKESDIAPVEYAYVDCDPKHGENIEAAQKRIREALASGVVPEPTFVYSSGGGMVALWKHAEPITDIEEAKAINVGLAQALGGKAEGFDSCQSVDHLYRLMNTTNIPNAKKRAKGRKRTVAGGLEGDGTRRYTPDDLPRGVVMLSEMDAPKLDGIEPIELDEVDIDDGTREIISTGRLADSPLKGDDNSNSAWRFRALGRLAKRGVSLEQVVGLFSDPANGELVEALHDKRNGDVAAVQRLVAKEYTKMKARIDAEVSEDFADDVNLPNDDDGETVVKLKSKKMAKVNPYAGVSLAAILAMKPPQWTLDGIIPKGAFFELFGREKAGKTFWALHMALCVATNTKCFGRRVTPGRVLYIIAEGNRRLFANRILAWIIGQAGDDVERVNELRAAIDENFRIIPVPIYMSRAAEAKALLEANPGAWSLVVIDTLFRNIEGDPNASKDMNQFVKGIDFVRTQWKATMLLLHHPGHANTERSQGSAALAAAIDGRARFFIGKDGKSRVWQVMFLRDGAVPAKPDAFHMTTVILEVGGQDFDFDDADSDDEDLRKPDVTSAYLSLIEDAGEVNRGGGELTDEDTLLIRIISEKPETQKALENDKWKRSKISRTVAELVMKGWLAEGSLTPTKKGTVYAETLGYDDDEVDENEFG